MKIKIAIIDGRADEAIKRRLTILGFRVIPLPEYHLLGDAVSAHTDMLILPLGDELVTYADYADREDYTLSLIWDSVKHTGLKIGCISDSAEREYPLDCRLNALRLGEKLFCKADSAPEYILNKAKKMGLRIVPTKQGYPACTVLKLTEDKCITADRGMAKILSENGISVTVIENGGISLPPHEYGFIGGCAGIYEDKIYFTGDISSHPSADTILIECDRAGLEVVCLSDGPLTDVGGILFLEGNVN